MGDPLLSQWPGMEHLKEDMQSRNLVTLWDISEWNVDGSWKSWEIPCPNHLERDKDILTNTLRGKSPISRNTKYSRGWRDKT